MRSLLYQNIAVFWLLLGGVIWHGVEKAQAADHFITSNASSIDCRTFNGGIRPGDTITLAGGPRDQLRIRNCAGTAQSPIVIRNDPSAGSPVKISRASASSGGFVFILENIEHIVVDGTAGWQGSSGDCGWVEGRLGTNCGIQITRTVRGDTPTAFLKLQGLFRNYAIRGLRIDGRSWGGNDLGGDSSSSGILQVSPELASDFPGYWRENILYERNYIHNTRTECMYIGPNWRTDGVRIPLRNITIQDNYMHDCGRNAITVKSAVDGTNVVQRNYAKRTGLQERASGLGGIFGYTTSHLTVRQNVVIDSAGQCYGINAGRIPNDYRGGYFIAENNLGVRCGVISHPELGHGISARMATGSRVIENVVIDYNTIVDSEANGIAISSNFETSAIAVRNNIVTTPKSGQALTGPSSRVNNRTGSVRSMRFRQPTADDYRLREDSPAIDSGTSPSPAGDLLNTPRPQGRASDQGAFECCEVVPVSPGGLQIK